MRETEDATGFPIISMVIYNAFDTGTYFIDAIGFFDVDEVSWGLQDTLQAKPVLEIKAYEQFDYVEGTAYGELSHRTNFDPPEYDYITFSLTFRAEFFNLDRPKCVDD